ncbi:MAG: hypothetical protein JWO94_1925 [Verrucomicrobiaceae bacterium]|nr:hypothetical protein [Verrucomicrobiaceae bacterium]
MAKKSSTSSSAVAFPDEDHDLLVFDDADEFMTQQPSAQMEDVQAKVHEAQAELMHLRQRQEEIERQKLHLEQIKKKQDAFGMGKRDLMEKLSRSVGTIERDLYNTQKMVEELTCTHKAFNDHLEVLRGLQPEKWQRHQVDEELGRALDAIEDAKDDYIKSSRRLVSLRPQMNGRNSDPADEQQRSGHSTSAAKEDFVVLVKRGLALSLPLIVAGLVGLILAKILF